jgi:hypothetical protein
MQEGSFDLNTLLKNEADRILNEYGLLNTIKKYGKPHVHGSYALNLMTHRDLDILVNNAHIHKKEFFDLGHELAENVKAFSMAYTDNAGKAVNKESNLLEGLLWCIHTDIIGAIPWKIDLWAVDDNAISNYKLKICNIEARLNEENRASIMKIKNMVCKHPLYGKKFTGIDIYAAVLNENVKTIDDFKSYINTREL